LEKIGEKYNFLMETFFMMNEFPNLSAVKNTKETVLRQELPFMREAYAKAEKMMKSARINPLSFISLYGSERVTRDMTWTEGMLQQHEKNFDVNKGHADIIEALLFEHIEQSEWFGKDAHTLKTSNFDDIRNKTDLLVEFENGKEQLTYLGLAVDVTFGETALRHKLEEIKKDIQENRLSKIEYFESERSPFKGEYRNLPRVVIGMDRSHMVDLVRMWMQDEKKKEFVSHPIQMLILQEIIDELRSFIQYAKKQGKNEMVTIYEKQLRIIEKIERRKNVSNADVYKKDDGVYIAIKKQLAIFKEG